MAHDVFVSYANQDKTTADAVVATLEQRDIRCWYAPRDVLPGHEYADALVEAINDAKVMVLVFSAKANASPHVMREVERAASKGIAILPFRIEDVAPSRSMEYFISGTHWLDALTPPLEQHLSQLAETVQVLLARAEGAAPATAVGARAPTAEARGAGMGAPPNRGVIAFAKEWGERPIVRIALGVGGVAVIALVLYFALNSGSSGRSAPDLSPTGAGTATSTAGDPATPTQEGGSAETTPVVASGEVVAVAVGGSHVCALIETGFVRCWGENRSGQLGDGSTTMSETPVYVCATGAGPPCTPSGGNVLGEVTAITAGDQHTCALTEAGGLKCWGKNDRGQLGDGTTNNRTTPVDADGLASGVAAIAAGKSEAAFSCVVTEAGGVKCWGDNGSGQLGDGTTTNRLTPGDVPGLTSGISAVATGGLHACAVTAVGGAKCWGSNRAGQLGDGQACGASKCTPVDVSGLGSGVAQIAVGGDHSIEHTCALTEGGSVKCWGDNRSGQIGIGSSGFGGQTVPDAPVQDLSSGVVAIAAGGRHSCAVTDAGVVKCWGENTRGQLGNGTTDTGTSPVDASGVSSGADAIEAGSTRTCIVTKSGGVMCWGDNQLTPLEVLGLD